MELRKAEDAAWSRIIEARKNPVAVLGKAVLVATAKVGNNR
jgi:hypothetical protein